MFRISNEHVREYTVNVYLQTPGLGGTVCYIIPRLNHLLQHGQYPAPDHVRQHVLTEVVL